MSKVIVRQFLLAIALIALYLTFRSVQSWSSLPFLEREYGSLPMALLKWLPRTITYSLPFASGIALALLPMRAGAFRQAAILIGGVTAFLLFNDIALRGAWEAYDAATKHPDPTDYTPRKQFNDTVSVMGGTWAHLLGRVRANDIQDWPPDTTKPGHVVATISDEQHVIRISAVMFYYRAGTFLFPFIGGGLVLGLAAWLKLVVTFRSPRDESLFRLVAAWVLVPSVIYFMAGIQNGLLFEISKPGAWMGWIIAPVAVALVPATLGWRAVWKLDSLADV